MEKRMIFFLGKDTFDAKGLAGIIWAWSKLRVKEKDHQKGVDGSKRVSEVVWMLDDDGLSFTIFPPFDSSTTRSVLP